MQLLLMFLDLGRCSHQNFLLGSATRLVSQHLSTNCLVLDGGTVYQRLHRSLLTGFGRLIFFHLNFIFGIQEEERVFGGFGAFSQKS